MCIGLNVDVDGLGFGLRLVVGDVIVCGNDVLAGGVGSRGSLFGSRTTGLSCLNLMSVFWKRMESVLGSMVGVGVGGSSVMMSGFS